MKRANSNMIQNKNTNRKNSTQKNKVISKKNKGCANESASLLKILKDKTPSNFVTLYGRHAVFSAIKNKKRELFGLVISSKKIKEFNELIKSNNIKLPRNFFIKEVDNRIISDCLDEEAVHQGFLLVTSSLPHLTLDSFFKKHECISDTKNKDLPQLVILDQITDPHNVGAIIRSAVAFGFKGLVLPFRNSSKDDSVISKTSVGTCENIDIIEVNNLNSALQDLKDFGYWCIGLDGYAKTYINEINYDNIAVIIGSEGKGIRDLVKKNCDVLVKIPMNENAESLNASVAGSIAMYELSKKRI